jgi:hypothetical protein
MENLLDFKPTGEELESLLGEDIDPAKLRALMEIPHPELIWKLMDMRGDLQRRDHYAQFLSPEYVEELGYQDLYLDRV